MSRLIVTRVGASLALLTIGVALSAQTSPTLRAMSYTTFTLPNGLVTIVNEDHSSPIFGIDLMYHVGSKDEPPGQQQMAHTCEHLMYEHSQHEPADARTFLGSFGGAINGSTRNDKTDFWGTYPASSLETVLWFEADKMRAPAFRSDSQTVERVRSTIADERRRGVVSPLYGGDHDAVLRALYPEDHPYSWGSGDVMPSLEQTSPARIHAFCAAHYVPSNAILALSGDVDPAKVRTWVEKYFGSIPRGSAPKTVVPRVALTGEKRIVQQDARARFPAMRVAWIGAGFASPDKVPLEALAFVLTGDRRSGLEKALVYDHKLASAVEVDNFDEELSGEFVVRITGLPNASLTRIEQIVDSVVASVRATAPPANALAGYRGSARLSATIGIGNRYMRADTLAEGEGYARDPVHYAKELDQVGTLTPDDVRRAARQYLTSGRVVLSLIPAGKLDMISKANLPYAIVDSAGYATPRPPTTHHVDSVTAAPDSAAQDVGPPPTIGPQAPFRYPQVERRTLSNGLRLVVVENHSLPLVAGRIVLDADSLLADPPGKEGLLQFDLAMLREGTTRFSGEQIATTINEMGSDVFIGQQLPIELNSQVPSLAANMTFTVTTPDLGPTLTLIGDMFSHPTFPAEAIERVRGDQLAELRTIKTLYSGERVPLRVFTSVVRGAPPRGATDEGLTAITRQDLVDFYARYVRPQLTTVVLAGDVSAAAAVSQVEKAFGGWSRGGVEAIAADSGGPNPATTIYLVDRPGASQSAIVGGALGPSSVSPDARAIEVFKVLSLTRLAANIRSRHGYAYVVQNANLLVPAPPARMELAAYSAVGTAKTDSALIEWMSEIKGMATRPASDGEMAYARSRLVTNQPLFFETPTQIRDQATNTIVRGASVFDDAYAEQIRAVTPADVAAVAAKYLDPTHLIFVVYGDRKVIEGSLRAANLGPVVAVDEDGKPVP